MADLVRSDFPPGASDSDAFHAGERQQRLDDVRARTRALAAAGDLAARRLAFRDLSGALTGLARRFGAPEGGLRLIFCPMAFGHAGAFWLQRDPIVNNPYHGLEMPRCGWEVEIIPSS